MGQGSADVALLSQRIDPLRESAQPIIPAPVDVPVRKLVQVRDEDCRKRWTHVPWGRLVAPRTGMTRYTGKAGAKLAFANATLADVFDDRSPVFTSASCERIYDIAAAHLNANQTDPYFASKLSELLFLVIGIRSGATSLTAANVHNFIQREAD
jgi:hypothetical protein